MSFIVVIPARYESTRLPGKPLLDIAGKPMLQHVVERALESNAKAVYVATDDERIAQACESFGAKVCMTSASHPSGTDRIEEVAQQLKLSPDDVIVNVQGDEPLIPAAVINQVAENMNINPNAGICTLCETISDANEILNPNAVKVVSDKNGMALYFSRAAIPFHRDGLVEGIDSVKTEIYKRHVGIYAYRVQVLHDFISWPVAEIEAAENLEQLRAMANGVRIHVAQACEHIPAGVDTEEDLNHVRAIASKTVVIEHKGNH